MIPRLIWGILIGFALLWLPLAIYAYLSLVAAIPDTTPFLGGSFQIVLCSDDDEETIRGGKDQYWESMLKFGDLKIENETASVIWKGEKTYSSQLNSRGRGMELSSLIEFDGNLLAPDDKTGIIYKLNDSKAVPWMIFADGNGEEKYPIKLEWMTLKDDKLYTGGHLFSEPKGKNGTLSDNSFWVKIISPDRSFRSEFWKGKLDAVKSAMKIEPKGFALFEGVLWSDIHRKWFFLPRAASNETFVKEIKSIRGSNRMVSTPDNFKEFHVVDIGVNNATRTFSSFKFAPGSHDSVIVALKTVETKRTPFESYIMVFGIDGKIFMNETRIEGNHKFEGLIFYDYNKL